MMMVSWFYYGNARFKGWSQTSTQYFSRIPRRYKKKKKGGKERGTSRSAQLCRTFSTHGHPRRIADFELSELVLFCTVRLVAFLQLSLGSTLHTDRMSEQEQSPPRPNGTITRRRRGSITLDGAILLPAAAKEARVCRDVIL